jgi:hypothetical protein
MRGDVVDLCTSLSLDAEIDSVLGRQYSLVREFMIPIFGWGSFREPGFRGITNTISLPSGDQDGAIL